MSNLETTYLTIMKLSNGTYPIYCEDGLVYKKGSNRLLSIEDLLRILMELY